MKLVTLLAFIIYLTIPNHAISMLTKIQPRLQEKNDILNKWRQSANNINTETHDILLSNPNLSLEEIAERRYFFSLFKDRSFRCFQYALEQTTGFKEHIDFPSKDNPSISIQDFFEQTDNPQFNDLVIYTNDEESNTPLHFAVAIDSLTFKSKWGTRDEVLRHPLFDLPENHGKAARFFTLKSKYKTSNGKKLLLVGMKNALDRQKLRLSSLEA